MTAPSPPREPEAVERVDPMPDSGVDRPNGQSELPAATDDVTLGRPMWAEIPLDERLIGWVGLFVAGFLSAFVFGFLNWPRLGAGGWDVAQPLLMINTTPSGGDMGAHVWGPAYLRDHLLPQGRLSGWTPDWYAGFPAYHFYMVIPPLAIIAINAGLPPLLGIPLAVAILAGAHLLADRSRLPRWVVWVSAAALAVVCVSVPYGVAFKLVSAVGVVLLPLAAWKMGRLAGSREPIPTFFAMAAFVFVFDTNFTIYGGNIASTLAGEFSFAICLMLTLLAIGLSARGMDNSSGRALTAVVIGLVALCHVLPVFFLFPAVGLLLFTHPSIPRAWSLVATAAVALPIVAGRDIAGLDYRFQLVAAFLAVLVAAAVVDETVRKRARWLLITGPVAVLLSSFWIFPFYARRDFFNDMGWEPLENISPVLLTTPMKIALPVAAIGVVLSIVARNRLGIVFAGTAVIFAVAVANVGDGPVWNARLLPFYYLSVYLLAAIGAAEVVRFAATAVSRDVERPDTMVVLAGTVAATVAVLVAVAMPLRLLPGGQVTGEGSYRWLAFSNSTQSFLPGWVAWNYSGYEQKASYAEYRQVVQTMGDLGADPEHGCGRAMWEHHQDLNRYGTPMALMLLPFWTDGCIGSMEGLYFESSASTPFHFLNQSILSEAPSRPQRELPYQDFDIDRGIGQLQASGVRYYMAQSDLAIAAAEEHPDLEQVAEAQPFVIFEVAGSDVVEGLPIEPVVVSGRAQEPWEVDLDISRFTYGWVSQAVAHYGDPDAYLALPAEDGPEEWTRAVELSPDAGREVTDPAEVSDVELSTNEISFSVDRVGAPVYVKASYFPNWDADGADGPWRAGPNLMVVVPTDTDVTLSYGRTAVDYVALALTLAGLAGLTALAVVDRGRRPGWWPGTTAATAESGDDGADDRSDELPAEPEMAEADVTEPVFSESDS